MKSSRITTMTLLAVLVVIVSACQRQRTGCLVEGATPRPTLKLADLLLTPAPDNMAGPVSVEIRGKQVTVDILAKSGTSGPATFTVGCELAGEESCGRKRFRVGIQPEPALFEIDVRPDLSDTDRAYLTINTDIVPATAEETGKGDPVDIVYVRLRVPK